MATFTEFVFSHQATGGSFVFRMLLIFGLLDFLLVKLHTLLPTHTQTHMGKNAPPTLCTLQT